MDSTTMEKLLIKEVETRCFFQGVFSHNNLPACRSVGLYIVNEQPSYEQGSHWVALHITPLKKKKNIYFDSYGQKPVIKEFQAYTGKNVQYNKKWLQHKLSPSCGQWCIYFVWRRSKGWKMKNITKPFNPKNPLVNDYAINYLVQKRFKMNQDVLDRKFLAG